MLLFLNAFCLFWHQSSSFLFCLPTPSFVILLQFELFANTIEDVSRIQYQALFDASVGITQSITAEAIALNQTFPFVTIPKYEVYAREARIASHAEVVSYSPRVKAEQIPAFNEYAAKNVDWIDKSRALQNQLENKDEVFQPAFVIPFVFDTTYDVNTGEQSVSPSTTDAEVLWHTSPLSNSAFLFMANLLSVESNTYDGPSPYDLVRITGGKYIFGAFAVLHFLFLLTRLLGLRRAYSI